MSVEIYCFDFSAFSSISLGCRSPNKLALVNVHHLFTTCTGGRNLKCAEAFAKGDGDWEKIETDLLNGQKLQGTGTAKDVMTFIKKLGCEKDFPLFCAILKIASEGAKPESIVDLSK